FIGLDQRGIDLHGFDFHLGGHAHRNQTAAGNALDLDLAEFVLHRLHLRLQLRRLLHHAEKISHRRSFLIRYTSSPSPLSARSSPSTSSAWDSGGSAARRRTSTTFAPGNRASTSRTRGSV